MANFTKLGGYLVEGTPELYTDNTLSGNGLESSPLGVIAAGNPEVDNVVTSNSATWNSVTGKLDSTAFSDVSGNFYTTANESGFITGIPDELTLTALNIIGQIDPEQSELESVIITQTGISLSNDLIGGENITITSIRDWNSTYETVSTNSASWTAYIKDNKNTVVNHNYNKTFSVTTQNVNYGISGKILIHNSTANKVTATYVATATTGTWTATGIAP